MLFLYLTIMLLPFQDHPILGAALFRAGPVPITPIKVVAVPMLLAAALFPAPRDAAPHRAMRIQILYAAFAGWLLMVTLVQTFSLPAFSTAQLLEFVLLLIAARSLVRNQQRFVNTIRVIVLAEVVGNLWTYKQYYLLHYPRPIGPSSDQNYEAMALAMAIPLAVWLFQREKNRFWRLFSIAAVPMMAFGIFVLQSRGGLLALCILAIAAWLLNPHKARNLVAAMVLLGILAAASPGATWRRIAQIQVSGAPTSGAGLSTESRVELMRAALHLTLAYPVFGVGLEQFGPIAERYNPHIAEVLPPAMTHVNMVHNTYLEISASGGLPALVMFIVLLIAANAELKQVQKGKPAAEDYRNLALAMRLSLFAFAAAAFFLTAWMQKELWFIVFLAASLREIALPAKRRLLFGSNSAPGATKAAA